MPFLDPLSSSTASRLETEFDPAKNTPGLLDKDQFIKTTHTKPMRPATIAILHAENSVKHERLSLLLRQMHGLVTGHQKEALKKIDGTSRLSKIAEQIHALDLSLDEADWDFGVKERHIKVQLDALEHQLVDFRRGLIRQALDYLGSLGKKQLQSLIGKPTEVNQEWFIANLQPRTVAFFCELGILVAGNPSRTYGAQDEAELLSSQISRQAARISTALSATDIPPSYFTLNAEPLLKMYDRLDSLRSEIDQRFCWVEKKNLEYRLTAVGLADLTACLPLQESFA